MKYQFLVELDVIEDPVYLTPAAIADEITTLLTNSDSIDVGIRNAVVKEIKQQGT